MDAKTEPQQATSRPFRPQSAEAVAGLDVTCLAAASLAAEGRMRIRLRLAEWGLEHLADDCCLVAAELISNACEATPQGKIGIRLARSEGAVMLAVWDGSERMPVAKPVVELTLDDLDLSEPNLDANGGWGLPLVQALSSTCGTSRTSPTGKWVWARFDVRPSQVD